MGWGREGGGGGGLESPKIFYKVFITRGMPICYTGKVVSTSMTKIVALSVINVLRGGPVRSVLYNNVSFYSKKKPKN